MAQRQIQLHGPEDKVEIAIGNHVVVAYATDKGEIRIEHPPGGVTIRGVPLEASESFILTEGEWRSYHDLKASYRLAVRPYGTYKDGSDAQRRSILSLYRQAAESFAQAHPERLAKAGVMAANNALYHAEAEVAKAQKALNEALGKQDEARARLDEAEDQLAVYGDGGAAPRM